MNKEKIKNLLVQVVECLNEDNNLEETVHMEEYYKESEYEGVCECSAEEENVILKSKIEQLELENNELKNKEKEYQFRIEKLQQKLLRLIEE